MTKEETTVSATTLATYEDPKKRFQISYPSEWINLSASGQTADGVALLPVSTDNLTCLSVEVVSLGVRVTGQDLQPLREGFIVGMDQLADNEMDTLQVYYDGASIAMGAHQTYSDGWGYRERYVWLIYRNTSMVRVVAQGSSKDEFKSLAPVFAAAMKSAKLAGKPAAGSSWLADFLVSGPISATKDPRRFYLGQPLPQMSDEPREE